MLFSELKKTTKKYGIPRTLGLHRPVDLRHFGVGVSEYGVEYEEVLLVDVGPEGGLHQALQLSRAEGLDNPHQGVCVAAVQSCRILK